MKIYIQKKFLNSTTNVLRKKLDNIDISESEKRKADKVVEDILKNQDDDYFLKSEKSEKKESFAEQTSTQTNCNKTLLAVSVLSLGIIAYSATNLIF